MPEYRVIKKVRPVAFRNDQVVPPACMGRAKFLTEVRASYPFPCSGCDQRFQTIIGYNKHVRNPSIQPPAMPVASLNSDPFVRHDHWAESYRSHFEGYQLDPIPTIFYWLYCAIAVPKHEYEATQAFDVRQYMKTCMQEKTPVSVYIGKCSSERDKMSTYHLDTFKGLQSSIGKSILEFEWFHVTSQQYRNLKELDIAETLAQTFVNWRCHHAKTRSSGVVYKPRWSKNQRQTFQNLTNHEHQLGLLRIYKDPDQFQLFCTRGLMGTCNMNHDEPIEVIKGQPPVTLLFSGNWHITEESLTPLKIRCVFTCSYYLIPKDATLSYLCTCRDVLPDYAEAEKQQMWEQEYQSVRACA
jgi:hypothetical protein